MKHYKAPDNSIWAYEEDGSQDHLIPTDFVPVTDEQSEAQRQANAAAAFDALSYQEKRQFEYPMIADQLDIIYHQGIDAWKTVIEQVKTKYPKV